MHVNHNPRALQQHRVRKHASNSDAYAFLNLLLGEQLLGKVDMRVISVKEFCAPLKLCPTFMRPSGAAPFYPAPDNLLDRVSKPCITCKLTSFNGFSYQLPFNFAASAT